MLHRFGFAALAGALLLSAALAAFATSSPADARAAAGPGTSLLFVQETRGARLERAARGRFRLRLRGVSPRVATFTDRPQRHAGQQGLRGFLRSWRGYGFAADPPNAALVPRRGGRGGDVFMLTLSSPRYNARHRTLTYTARPLRSESGDALAGLARRGDRPRPGRLGAASLFVDDGGSSQPVYKPIVLQVDNAQPGQKIGVELISSGVSTAWSAGPPFQNTAEIEVTPETNELPLGRLDVNSSEVSFLTESGSGGGALAFQVRLYLVADADVATFYLRSSSDPGVEITAQISGSASQAVNESQTLFTWNPL